MVSSFYTNFLSTPGGTRTHTTLRSRDFTSCQGGFHLSDFSDTTWTMPSPSALPVRVGDYSLYTFPLKRGLGSALVIHVTMKPSPNLHLTK